MSDTIRVNSLYSPSGIAGSISKQAIGLKATGDQMERTFMHQGLSVPKITSPIMRGSYLKGSLINRLKNSKTT